MTRNVTRYLEIVDWAKARYADGGYLVTTVGARPTRFRLIEDLAAARYVGFDRHFPKDTLKTAAVVGQS